MKTKPYNRHETFLAALSDSSITVPTPLSREELYLAKIAGESVTLPAAPYNRYETYLAKIAGQTVTVPTPASRLEYYLYKACGYDVQEPIPANREEIFWKRYIGSDVSGSTITITDALAGPPRECVLNIIAKQTFEEGQTVPSPDHPAPISGWTEAVVTIKDADGVTETTYTRDLTGAGTVYGGRLEIADGLLTVTHFYKEYDGTETWGRSGSATNPSMFFYNNIASLNVILDNTDTSSHFKHELIYTASTEYGARVYNSTSNARYAVRPGIQGIDTADLMKNWVQGQYNDGTPVQVICRLKTPEQYLLSPYDFELLPGVNAITCNCGTITLKYTPDL